MTGNNIFHIFVASFIHILCLPSEIFCITTVFVACLLCLYKCTDPELKTAHDQATITALYRIFHLEDRNVMNRESFHIVHFFRENGLNSPSKIKPVCCKYGVSTGWLCIMYLSSENFYNLFDSIVPLSVIFISNIL